MLFLNIAIVSQRIRDYIILISVEENLLLIVFYLRYHSHFFGSLGNLNLVLKVELV